MGSNFADAYAALERQFRQLAQADGRVYVPNPEPAGPVDFLFIAEDPSLGRWAGTSRREADDWM
jgi:hypothetical protein